MCGLSINKLKLIIWVNSFNQFKLSPNPFHDQRELTQLSSQGLVKAQLAHNLKSNHGPSQNPITTN